MRAHSTADAGESLLLDGALPEFGFSRQGHFRRSGRRRLIRAVEGVVDAECHLSGGHI
ncbi:hypothetical protein ACI2L1_40835 [Streptomyces sp. NPDC019531]|uniref:hypothetical protein n=1 Tax=Streptomyces sp. NPDC019531 TaxID=3365062 RepID=UPI00384AC53D